MCSHIRVDRRRCPRGCVYRRLRRRDLGEGFRGERQGRRRADQERGRARQARRPGDAARAEAPAVRRGDAKKPTGTGRNRPRASATTRPATRANANPRAGLVDFDGRRMYAGRAARRITSATASAPRTRTPAQADALLPESLVSLAVARAYSTRRVTTRRGVLGGPQRVVTTKRGGLVGCHFTTAGGKFRAGPEEARHDPSFPPSDGS